MVVFSSSRVNHQYASAPARTSRRSASSHGQIRGGRGGGATSSSITSSSAAGPTTAVSSTGSAGRRRRQNGLTPEKSPQTALRKRCGYRRTDVRCEPSSTEGGGNVPKAHHSTTSTRGNASVRRVS